MDQPSRADQFIVDDYTFSNFRPGLRLGKIERCGNEKIFPHRSYKFIANENEETMTVEEEYIGKITRHFLNLRDQKVREFLIAHGWTPPQPDIKHITV